MSFSLEFVQFFGKVGKKLFSWVGISDTSGHHSMDLLVLCGCFLAVHWGFAWLVSSIDEECSI